MKKCSICDGKHEGLGFCRKHYRSFKKYGTPFFPKKKYPSKNKCNLCERLAKSKGFCDRHYRKLLRNGNASAPDGREKRKNDVSKMLRIIEKIKPNENGCKIWPMGINSAGYGHFSLKNKSFCVSRLLYYTLYPNTEINLVVRHKCDVRSCCNIDHLEIGTQKNNIEDASKRNRLRVGEENKMSSLTEKQVLYCREAYPVKSTWELSKELGVNANNIGNAICGKTWKHLPNEKKVFSNNSAKGIKHPKSKLNDEIVLKIISEYPSKTGTQLAKKYGVSHGNIYAILNKRTWKHLWE